MSKNIFVSILLSFIIFLNSFGKTIKEHNFEIDINSINHETKNLIKNLSSKDEKLLVFDLVKTIKSNEKQPSKLRKVFDAFKSIESNDLAYAASAVIVLGVLTGFIDKRVVLGIIKWSLIKGFKLSWFLIKFLVKGGFKLALKHG